MKEYPKAKPAATHTICFLVNVLFLALGVLEVHAAGIEWKPAATGDEYVIISRHGKNRHAACRITASGTRTAVLTKERGNKIFWQSFRRNLRDIRRSMGAPGQKYQRLLRRFRRTQAACRPGSKPAPVPTVSPSPHPSDTPAPPPSDDTTPAPTSTITVTPTPAFTARPTPTPTPTPGCGDSFCNGSETCSSCSNDCGECGTTYTITAAAGAGGSISPSGTISVNEGANIAFTITPDPGYEVKNIVTAGVSEGAAASFHYYLVKSNYALQVSFIAKADETPETIFVDNQLSSNCPAGNYSIAARSCTGSDGRAYTSITEACDVAGPGDTVSIRAGIYHQGNGAKADVIWPKHSGTAERPIVFKPFNYEAVVIGDDPGGSWPNDLHYSIARGAITLKNVHHIRIEGLTFRHLAGWLFARGCSHITIEDCWFEQAMYDAKGGGRLIECTDSTILNNTFLDSAYDALVLQQSDYNVIEGNAFTTAKHSLLSLRSASYNVIRNNVFNNYASEKLTEEFDQKLDTRDSANPAYSPVPWYNRTRHNVFENNLFGFTTEIDYVGSGSRCSAMQFSGQNTIIRKNIFSNPLNAANPDLDYAGTSGGVAIVMRWGGSWDGWSESKQRIVGEGHEAGYVYGNRIYANTFYGYDGSKITFPTDNALANIPNPPPMKNVEDYLNYPYTANYAFEDNELKNNIFCAGALHAYINWSYLTQNEGKPVQTLIRGRASETSWINNNFYASGSYADNLIYNHVNFPYAEPKKPSFYNENFSNWSGNLQLNPLHANSAGGDFHLSAGSELIDAGAHLAKTVSSGSGTVMPVNDVKYFFDGYGITGEAGDVVQLEGQTETARIINIDHAANTMALDRSLSWSADQGVSLSYNGSRPDIGAVESDGK